MYIGIKKREESDSPLLDRTKNSIPLSLLSSIPALPPAISQAAPNVTSLIKTPWSTTLSPVPVQEFSSGYMYLMSPIEKQTGVTLSGIVENANCGFAIPEPRMTSF